MNSQNEHTSTWQIVSPKRKRVCTSSQQTTTTTQTAPSVISNRFHALSDNSAFVENEAEMNTCVQNTSTLPPTTTPKPPPIFLPGIYDIAEFKKFLGNFLKPDEYKYISNQKHTKLNVSTIENYRKLIKELDNSKHSYHTYQVKQDKSFRVVIKKLHATTPLQEIKEALLSCGHEVRNITNVISRKYKTPLSMFFVDLEPKSNNKDIYHLNSINNAIISIEPYNKPKELLQCHRCQGFGHTKAYCKMPYNCVKCGLNHPTKTCKKGKDAPPKCMHCNGEHTANYKGCVVYQQLIKKRTGNATNTSTPIRAERAPTTLNERNPANSYRPQYSYASVTRQDPAPVHEQPHQIHDPLTQTLLRIEVMLTRQMDLITLLVNKLSS